MNFIFFVVQITSEEFPEDTANTRGHLVMKANLQSYRIVSLIS